MSQTYTLTIYIGDDLVYPKVLIANCLTLARIVSGKRNVVFQTKNNTQLSNSNQFQWKESYKIGAVTEFPNGAMKTATSKAQIIQPGQICDWTPRKGDPDFQQMPEPREPPEKLNWNEDEFGTINEPDQWYNTIWCETGAEDKFNCIYVDNSVVPGRLSRSYHVENNIQVSWEDKDISESVIHRQWTNAITVKYNGKETAKYISWGRPLDGGSPLWYEYKNDPEYHDPSIGTKIPYDLERIARPESINIQYDFGANYLLSDAGLSEYASKLASYLPASAPSYLHLDVSTDKSVVSVNATLDKSSSCYDLIPGISANEKTTAAVQHLIHGISPAYVPPAQRTTFSGAKIHGLPLRDGNDKLFVGTVMWTANDDPQIPVWSEFVNELSNALRLEHCQVVIPTWHNQNRLCTVSFKSELSLNNPSEVFNRAFNAIPNRVRADMEPQGAVPAEYSGQSRT